MRVQEPGESNVFHDSLCRAIAQGVRPPPSMGLGADTFTAIDVIAVQHPDATPDHIAHAYDAFGREHRAGE